MEFQLLGPLEVRFDDRVVPVGPKHRSLLAALLLGANRIQSTSYLIRTLWGDDPPPTARNLISVYVHQIRKAIRAAGGMAPEGMLVTQPPGYLFRVPDSAIDLRAFERLVAEARMTTVQNDAARTSTLLGKALALWRGPALSNVDSELLREVELPRLEEARLTATEARIEADLALGMHGELVGELESLVSSHPFRERIYGQLMLSLYRSGRRGEAMHAYQRCREVLVAELGMEPGPDLRLLLTEILDDDSSLRLTPAAQKTITIAQSVAPIPSQLPGVAADFTGRKSELERIESLLAHAEDDPVAGVVVLITGMPGIGKTALATRAAWNSLHRHSDGQIYADLRGSGPSPADPGDVLAGVLAAFGLDRGALPASLFERQQLYRSYLARRRVLVVLDDASHEAQVRPLLCTSPGSATIITSRSRLPALESARVLNPGVFHADESIELLGKIVGTDRVTAEAGPTAAIARLTGNLPLAIRIAGASLAAHPHWPIGRLAARLAHDSLRLAELSIGDLAVEAAFEASYLGLDRRAQLAFRLLGVFRQRDIPSSAVGASLEVDTATAENLLDQLVQANLIEVTRYDPNGEVWFRLPILLRDYARARLVTEEPDAARIRRTYLAAARTTMIAPAGGPAPAARPAIAPARRVA